MNPIAAIIIASLGLAVIFGPASNRLGLDLRQPTISPADAVDISLQRLVRSRVTERFKNQHRLNASPLRNFELIDCELRKIREHALYERIKEMMIDHLRKKGYERVPLRLSHDPKNLMLSIDAEFALNRFIHSLRASLAAPNEKVAVFLRDHEARFGESIVDYLGANQYVTAFPFLIQLLFEFPDDLEPIANAVKFIFDRDLRPIGGASVTASVAGGCCSWFAALEQASLSPSRFANSASARSRFSDRGEPHVPHPIETRCRPGPPGRTAQGLLPRAALAAILAIEGRTSVTRFDRIAIDGELFWERRGESLPDRLYEAPHL